ncbi:MAG: alpha/beta fold hydrolase [Campylobacterota bacterium]|nr:alpha/beta fold hydrolase [Campylobacterota bacterium]
MKKVLLIGLAIGLCANLFGAKISQTQCESKEDSFIFAGGECIQYSEVEGEVEGVLTIVVHGTWKEGTDTLGRYEPFAETLNMATDITTVAVALPGYSGSSTNNFEALSHNGTKHLAAQKEYIEFLGELVKSLKEKYNAKTINYIGHSAGAAMGATLSAYKPTLIDNIVLAGGSYDIDKKIKQKGLISTIDFIDNIKETKYLLIYGTKDKISPPSITIDFYKIAKKKGVDVQIVKVEGAEHLDLDMTDTSVDAITEMLEN